MRRAVAVVAAAMVLGCGCAAGHNALGTQAEPCFRALPAAIAAQHRHGRLVGVRSVSDDTASQVLGHPTGTSGVCLVAFRGDYSAADVDHLVATSPRTGHYAIVAVGQRSRLTIGTRLTDRLPLRFHHTR